MVGGPDGCVLLVLGCEVEVREVILVESCHRGKLFSLLVC